MGAVLHQIGGAANSQGASATRYQRLLSNVNNEVTATESEVTTLWRTAGTFSNLYINVLTNDRAASTYRTRKSTANANLVVSITGSTTGKFEDTSNSDTVAAGDDWHTSIVTGAGGTTFTYRITSVLFTATTNTVQRIAGGADNTFSAASTTSVGTLYGNSSANTDTIDSRVGITFRTAGTLKNFLVYISSNSRTTTTTYGSRLNGANGALTISVTSGATGSFEDTSNSDTIASGDLVNWTRTTGTGTESCTHQTIAADFESTNGNHHYVVGNRIGTTQSANVTNYYAIAGLISADTTESNVQAETNLAFTASKLQINISANTVSADSTLKLRKNTADANQVVTITASTTGIFQDATNTDSIVASDVLDYQLVTGATGTSLTIRSITLLGAVASGVTFSASPLTLTSVLASPSLSVNRFSDALQMTSALSAPVPRVSVTPNPSTLLASLQSVSYRVTKTPGVFELIFVLPGVTTDAGSGSPKTVSVQPLLMSLGFPSHAGVVKISPAAQGLIFNLPGISKRIVKDAGPIILTIDLPGINKKVSFQPVSQTMSLLLTETAQTISVQVSAQELDAVLNSITLSGVDVVIRRRTGPKVMQFLDPVRITLNIPSSKVSKSETDGKIVNPKYQG